MSGHGLKPWYNGTENDLSHLSSRERPNLFSYRRMRRQRDIKSNVEFMSSIRRVQLKGIRTVSAGRAD